MDAILLNVKTVELTKALKHLCRIEKQDPRLILKYSDGLLTMSIGRTHQDLPANGFWPEPVYVDRKWAETLAQRPYDVSVMTLSLSEGKLWGRDYGVSCSSGVEPVQDEDAVKRQNDIDAAVRKLSRHLVTERDIKALIDDADADKASLGGGDEGGIAMDVARAWMSLFSYGVEPSDIKKTLHRKSRELFKNPPGHK